MARRSALRASDDDREHVARRLRDATAEGRLLASELEERLSTLFSSRTYGELDVLTSDLPAADSGRRGRATPLWTRIALAAAVVMAVLAVLATIALLLLGIAGAWVAWMAVAWFVFGRGRWARRGGCSRRPVYLRHSGSGSARIPRGGHSTL